MAAYTTIDDPGLYFNTIIWTGSSDTAGRAFTGVGFEPDLVWQKIRNDTYNHKLYDSVRGAGNDKELMTDTWGPEGASSAETYGYLSSFDADGFTTTAGTSGSAGNLHWNQNTYKFVAWNWKESADAGFDIISFTGTGSARTVSHSLSAVPKLIIVKTRSTDEYDWLVYHGANTSAPETDALRLGQDGDTNNTDDDASYWNDTAPTSSVFTVGTSGYSNKNTDSMIAYAFAEKQGFSKFGGYTGNGNADGVFIYLGFKPAWFLCKNTQDDGDNWVLHDNKRNTFNVTDAGLAPNTASAEFTDVDMDFLSNGVKMRNNTGRSNGTSKTFIYAAFAETPFVNSNGVPCNAK